MAYTIYTPVLFLYTPPHTCAAPPTNETLSSDQLLVRRSENPPDEDYDPQCYDYYETTPGGDPELLPCQYGWDYNTTGLFSSVVTDLDWVCADDWKGPFTQAMFFLGASIGTLCFGYVGDIYGRYPAFFTSNLLLFVTGITLPYCTNLYSFSAVRFLMGLTHTTYFTTLYLLALEYVSVSKRSIIGNVSMAIGLSLGGVMEVWLLKLVYDWKILHQILFAQAALVIITPCFVQESVRWLISRGHIDKAIVVLKRIAKINNKDVDDEIYDGYKKIAQDQFNEEQAIKPPSIMSLFQTPELRKRVILMGITWMWVTFLYDGHVRNLTNLNYDIYVTFTLSSAIELPGDLLSIVVLEKLGRKWGSSICLFLSGVSIAICGLLIETGNAAVVITLSMMGRFFITLAGNTAYQLMFELMPTQLRHRATSLKISIGFFCNIFSPYVAYSSNLYLPLPFLILGIGGILAAMTAIQLPETAGEKLPDTVAEAKDFGRGQKFFEIPITKRRRLKKEMKALEKQHDEVKA